MINSLFLTDLYPERHIPDAAGNVLPKVIGSFASFVLIKTGAYSVKDQTNHLRQNTTKIICNSSGGANRLGALSQKIFRAFICAMINKKMLACKNIFNLPFAVRGPFCPKAFQPGPYFAPHCAIGNKQLIFVQCIQLNTVINAIRKILKDFLGLI